MGSVYNNSKKENRNENNDMQRSTSEPNIRIIMKRDPIKKSPCGWRKGDDSQFRPSGNKSRSKSPLPQKLIDMEKKLKNYREFKESSNKLIHEF